LVKGYDGRTSCMCVKIFIFVQEARSRQTWVFLIFLLNILYSGTDTLHLNNSMKNITGDVGMNLSFEQR
jgi:uncharacterized membrane protein